MNTATYALAFKALSDETRLRIVLILLSKSQCACHLLEEVAVSQPTLSYHMKLLCDSGLVEGDKQGVWMHYSITPLWINKLQIMLQELVPYASKDCLVSNCRQEEES